MANQMLSGNFVSHIVRDHVLELKSSNGVTLFMHILTDKIIRFRYITGLEVPQDFSYALDVNQNHPGVDFDVKENDNELIVSTQKVNVILDKSNFSISITDLAGKIILEDEKGFHWEDNYEEGGDFVYMSKFVQKEEHYYGLGDKPVHSNLRGKRLVNWAMDEYGFHKDTDPIYKCIPFYLGIHHARSYGIFFDNTFKSHFDFASERKTVTSFWADGGEMNYYFIYGPDMLDVTSQYNYLTGVPELPPMWALGYHQCKWSYYPESEVRDITTKLRENRIPCDAFYLDIDYMDGFRCFTWDNEKFPAPKKMISDLADQGFKTIVIIDPGIKIDTNYDVFNEALEKGYFLRRADGPLVQGKVWPGECYFPDFTDPEVREWWSGLFKGLISEDGVRGVWNDMNEPAVMEVESKTVPLDVRHNYDGNWCSHRKAHNIYGMQMAKATQKGVKNFVKPFRPFVITRSVYSGGQRYSSAWTGDNIASWEHLWLAQVQCQRMSMSGFSFVGSDVGGFISHPTPELYTRWVQAATFHVFFRTHSSGDHGDQEPWSFGTKTLDIVRKFIELRYNLLPYLYTAFYQHVKYGTPILRPIAAVDQEDRETLNRTDECLHGDHILFCPILEPNVLGRHIYLPKGQWFNYWDDVMYEGREEHFVEYKIDSTPFFLKAGSVLPMYPIQQYTGEKKIEVLDLHVYFVRGEEKSLLYEDGGDGYGYMDGISNEKVFTVRGSSDSLELIQSINGQYTPEYALYKLHFHGLPSTSETIMIDGKNMSMNLKKQEVPCIELASGFTNAVITF